MGISIRVILVQRPFLGPQLYVKFHSFASVAPILFKESLVLP